MVTAAEYIRNHWEKKRVYSHLEWPKHQTRLGTCALKAGARGGETFADVGCAFGHSTAIMRKAQAGIWTAIDFFPGTVEMVNKFFPDMPAKEIATVADLGALAGVFDGVVCSEVIEHVEDDAALVAGLLTMTKRNLVITTPCKPVNDPGHLRVYTDAQLCGLVPPKPGRYVTITTLLDLFWLLLIEEGM